MAAAAIATALLLVSPASAQRRDAAEFAEGAYRRALSDLARGSLALAVAGVVAAEDDLSARCVQAIELHTARQLAELEAESLVVQAFMRVAVQQERHPQRGGSAHLLAFEQLSISTARQLDDLYLAGSTSAAAPALAAGLLTYVARDVSLPRSAGRLATAKVLLEEALEHDPDHPAALHSLAVTFELMGRPGQALPLLERLLAIDPANRRFLLRRAVVTAKAGRERMARDHLAQLATGGVDWVGDLATQELARLLLAAGEEAAAEELLRQALRERPDGKLALQLAALLDPRWDESWEVLRTLAAAPPGDPGASPRWLYDLGSEPEIDVLRSELNAAMFARLDALASALGRLPEPGDFDRKTLAACR